MTGSGVFTKMVACNQSYPPRIAFVTALLCLFHASLCFGQTAGRSTSHKRSEPQLLSRSVRVTDYRSGVYRDWFWISDHEAIYSEVGANGSSLQLFRLNAWLGKRTPLSTVNTAYKEMFAGPPVVGNGTAGPAFASITLSPNGQWLLFHPASFTSSGKNNCPVVSVNVDGSGAKQWRSTDRFPYKLVWLADNHRWLEPVVQYNNGSPVVNKFVVRDLFRTDYQRVIPFTETVTGKYVFPLRNNRLCVIEPGEFDGKGSRCLIATKGLDTPGPFETIFLHMPFEVSDVSVSTSSGLIAWLVYYIQAPPAPNNPVRRKRAGVPAPPRVPAQRHLAIWVTDIHGAHAKDVGDVQVDQSDEISQLQWIPGFRSISFVYKQGIYTVPAGPLTH